MKYSQRFLMVCCLAICGLASVFASDSPEATGDFSGHDAVILEAKGIYDHRFTVELSKEIYSVKIRFLTQKGIDDFGYYTIEYNPSKEHVSSIDGEVTLPDGSKIKIKKSDMFEKKVVDRGRGKKTQIKVVYPSLEPGAEVAFSYQRSFNGAREVSYWNFQSELFTVHSEVSFTPWWDRRWGYTVRNAVQEPEVKETRPGGNKTYTLIRKNIAALPKEDYSLAYASLREGVAIYYEDGWSDTETYWSKDVAKLYKKYIYPYMKPSSPSRKVISENFQKKNLSNDEMILALYDYVAENFVSLDMLTKKEEQEVDDAYRTRLSKVKSGSDLFDFRYLTDWEMNYVLAALIQSAVPAAKVELVLYTPWDENTFNTLLKSLQQFTERALKVTCDGKTWWLSPGKRYLPPDMIDWSAKGIHVLVLDEKTSALEKIPLDKYADNPSHVGMQVSFNAEEGFATMQRRTEYNRYMSYDMRTSILYLAEHEHRDFMETEVRDMFGKETELLSFSFENLTDFAKPLIVNFECKYPYEFEEAGNQILMDFPGLALPSTNPFVSEERHSQVMFRYPYVEKRDITYTIPDEYTIRKCPKNVRINKDVMMYRVDYEKIGDHQVKVTSEVTLQGNMMRKEAAEFLRRTYNEVLEARRNKLILAEAE